MKADLAKRLHARADGYCECGCLQPFDDSPFSRATFDHALGRARAPESEETVWVLREDHHYNRTNSIPSRVWWLKRWEAHCRKHGYVEQATKAGSALFYAKAKASLGEGAA